MGTPEVPLEHAHETIEHHAHGASEPWVMGVALTAAILAALAAVTALYAEHFANEAMLERSRQPTNGMSPRPTASRKNCSKRRRLLKNLKKDLDPEEEKKLREYPNKKEENRDEAEKHAGAVRRPCSQACAAFAWA